MSINGYVVSVWFFAIASFSWRYYMWSLPGYLYDLDLVFIFCWAVSLVVMFFKVKVSTKVYVVALASMPLCLWLRGEYVLAELIWTFQGFE